LAEYRSTFRLTKKVMGTYIEETVPKGTSIIYVDEIWRHIKKPRGENPLRKALNLVKHVLKHSIHDEPSPEEYVMLLWWIVEVDIHEFLHHIGEIPEKTLDKYWFKTTSDHIFNSLKETVLRSIVEWASK
jgi:hypothetical protein